jgi:hypothetical protein
MSKLIYMEKIFESKINQKVCKSIDYGCPYHSCLGNFCQYGSMQKEHRVWTRSCAPDIRQASPGMIIFMPYSKEDRCEKCILANYPEECKKVQCKAEERTDRLTGYFRLYRSSAPIDQPVPKGMALIVMLILFSASVLFSSCVTIKVTVNPKEDLVELDSLKVTENIWY